MIMCHKDPTAPVEPEDPHEPFFREWGHEHNVEMTDRGVKVDWGVDGWSFIPWASVLRVDYQPDCWCVTCRQTYEERQAPS